MHLQEKLNFRSAKIADIQCIRSIMNNYSDSINQYSAAFLLGLSAKYGVKIAFYRDNLFCAMERRNCAGYMAFLVPKGSNAFMDNLGLLQVYAQLHNKRIMLWGTSSADEKIISEQKLSYRVNQLPDFADYVYSVKELEALAGRIYANKRLALNRFKNRYLQNSCFKIIGDGQIAAVKNYQAAWYKEKIARSGYSEGLYYENLQINMVLDNYDKFKAVGGYVAIADSIAAYILAVPIDNNSYDVFALKVLWCYGNIDTYLINEFAKAMANSILYMNFEEDLGIAGLREFKERYKPCKMLTKRSIYLL